jgi:hypothetical protein
VLFSKFCSEHNKIMASVLLSFNIAFVCL